MKRKMCNQDGRSMVEMLGVLAIVGVLSVAGISGYIKAMNEYRISKVITDYTSIFNSVLELGFSLRSKIAPHATNTNRVYFASLLEQLGWLPKNWTRVGNQIYDGYFHHKLSIYYRGDFFIFNLYINQSEAKSKINTESIRFCQRIVSDFARQYHDSIYYLSRYEEGVGKNGQDRNTVLGYGKNYCGGGRKCLISQTPAQILKFCRGCIGEENDCRLRFQFKP